MPSAIKVVLFGLLIGVLAPLSAQAQQSDATAELGPTGLPVPIPSVKLLAAEDAEFAYVRRFFGRIAARETVDLSFEVGGRLISLPVVEGETIPKGTVVAALEKENFERAVARAELALEQAKREQSRAARLAASNVASAVRAEDSATARELAEVELNDARDQLSDATLRTPFDALVADRVAANFSNVSPGQTILRLHDMSQIRVQIDVPERLFQTGIPPEAITFTGEVAYLDDPIPLELIEFEAQTEAIGQTFLVTLVLPELNLPSLIPGASMTVIAAVDRAYSLPGRPVPATALVFTPDRQAKAMVFQPDPSDPDQGVVREKLVEVTSPSGTELRVLGLDPQDEIVAAGAHMLADGQKVRRYTGLTVEE